MTLHRATRILLSLCLVAAACADTPVQSEVARLDCPDGSEQVGAHPPDGIESWCQRELADGSIQRHGPARQWYRSGQIKASGSFSAGEPSSDWRCWSLLGEELEFSWCAGANVTFPARRSTLHVVAHGETVWDIAGRHQPTVNDIARANGLRPRSSLRSGLQLDIPEAVPPVPRSPEEKREDERKAWELALEATELLTGKGRAGRRTEGALKAHRPATMVWTRTHSTSCVAGSIISRSRQGQKGPLSPAPAEPSSR